MARRMSERELRGLPTTEIGENIVSIQDTIKKMAGHGYYDDHPAIVRMQELAGRYVGELTRRDGDGGKAQSDVRVPAWTDGDRIAAGLEPLDDMD